MFCSSKYLGSGPNSPWLFCHAITIFQQFTASMQRIVRLALDAKHHLPVFLAHFKHLWIRFLTFFEFLKKLFADQPIQHIIDSLGITHFWIWIDRKIGFMSSDLSMRVYANEDENAIESNLPCRTIFKSHTNLCLRFCSLLWSMPIIQDRYGR